MNSMPGGPSQSRQVPIPHGPQSVAELIAGFSTRDGEALVGFSSSLSYRALVDAIDTTAVTLSALGLNQGDRVAMSAPSDSDLIVTFLATQKLGLVWMGLNRMLAAPEKAAILMDAGASALIADAEIAGQMRDQMPDGVRLLVLDAGDDSFRARCAANLGQRPAEVTVDPFAPAAIAYTSGTTGQPKGAIHSQHSMMTFVMAGLTSGRGGCWTSPQRRSVSIPLTILNGMVFGALVALQSGGTFVCLAKLDAASVVDTIERHSVEVIGTATTTIYDLLNKPNLKSRTLPSLEYAFAGGALVSEDMKAAFRARFGSELGDEYGLTESPCSLVGGLFDRPNAPGSVGLAYPHIEVRALSNDGAILPPDALGELCARAVQSGPWAGVYTGMLGYWNRPEETAATLADGWLHTGDIGKVDANGMVYVVSRKKETIVRGGANIYPGEVERVLKAHAAVSEAVVAPLPDDRLGEIAAAYIELEDATVPLAALHQELVALCERELARYKIPERWFIITDLPRNAGGKPERKKLGQLDCRPFGQQA